MVCSLVGREDEEEDEDGVLELDDSLGKDVDMRCLLLIDVVCDCY
jgi:hypothetical protein